ncbi:bifunctional 4-hydroxy-2-oxoglutarate aldolase/2-dehydro-3-deoxy-phosphogluconate aldolase [Pseudonocardia halophobica]|uniref:bifunctional 4-hydroxy-2-oxoglutarate aldolase/2-dehydro-3-deoxy-phosphogluconate aldolase n=1 Tax=Pseudonocardia halophobica TaxID=29401 RepID=UPI003D92255B
MTLPVRCPVLPVVVLDDPAQALPLGEALLAGGVDVVEITLRTAAGLAGIRALRALPELHVGAGSVVVPRHVDQVVEAGARFVVSPGLSVSVLDRAVELDVAALPGVSGASDLMVATERGLTEVKFFPANLLGGVAGIRALAAPFPGMTFLPSGGVKPENMGDYLALPCVPAVSGSWMVDPELLAAGRWDEVTARAADALGRARGAVPVG